MAAAFFQSSVSGQFFSYRSYNINLPSGAKGRSSLHLHLEIVRRIVGVAAAFIGLRFGIYRLLEYGDHASDLPLHQLAITRNRSLTFPRSTSAH